MPINSPATAVLLRRAAAAVFLLLLIRSAHGGDTESPSSPAAAAAVKSAAKKLGPYTTFVVVMFVPLFFYVVVTIAFRSCIAAASCNGAADHPVAGVPLAGRGLDPRLIESFPALSYSEALRTKGGGGFDDGELLACAVCLCEFDVGEVLRQLPSPCRHLFHTDFIAAWLARHVTCPVCRADLSALPRPGGASASAAPVAVEIDVAEAKEAAELERIGSERQAARKAATMYERSRSAPGCTYQPRCQHRRRRRRRRTAAAAPANTAGLPRRRRLPLLRLIIIIITVRLDRCCLGMRADRDFVE